MSCRYSQPRSKFVLPPSFATAVFGVMLPK